METGTGLGMRLTLSPLIAHTQQYCTLPVNYYPITLTCIGQVPVSYLVLTKTSTFRCKNDRFLCKQFKQELQISFNIMPVMIRIWNETISQERGYEIHH